MTGIPRNTLQSSLAWRKTFCKEAGCRVHLSGCEAKSLTPVLEPADELLPGMARQNSIIANAPRDLYVVSAWAWALDLAGAASWPVVRSASRPAGHPVSQSASRPAGHPESRPESAAGRSGGTRDRRRGRRAGHPGRSRARRRGYATRARGRSLQQIFTSMQVGGVS